MSLGFVIAIIIVGYILFIDFIFTRPNRKRVFQVMRENPHFTAREAIDQVTREVRAQRVPDDRNTLQVKFRSGLSNDNIVVESPKICQCGCQCAQTDSQHLKSRPVHADADANKVDSCGSFVFEEKNSPRTVVRRRRKTDRNKALIDEYEKDGLPY